MFQKKHRSQFYSNCWHCSFANPDGFPCAKAVHIHVGIWRMNLEKKGALGGGPRGYFPKDKKVGKCPGFELSIHCVKEDRDVMGFKVNKRELE